MNQANFGKWKREHLKDPHRLTDKSQRVRAMFSGIVRTYDLLNHLLSFNCDRRWRRRAVELAQLAPGGMVLDLCCGTGDLALEFLAQYPDLDEVIGVDFAEPMLTLAAAKGRLLNNKKAGRHKILVPRWLCGDARCLPLANERFDCVSCAFGMRNLQDVSIGLGEIRRVLKPGGKLVILEFALPHNKIIAWLYQCYFRLVLPLIGSIIAQDHNCAYQYLPASVDSFKTAERLNKLIQETGFSDMYTEELNMATVLALVATKS